jgi:diguanylate cyclase (GGDEF)-like protein/PAS domain S-box-containing protein
LPTNSSNYRSESGSFGALGEIMRFKVGEEYSAFEQTLGSLGMINDYLSALLTFDHRIITVSISASTISVDGNKDYAVMFLNEIKDDDVSSEYQNVISSIINATLLAKDVEASIQTILALAGKYSSANRVYIFEEVDKKTTRNTYEWCDEGVEPAIDDLQNLSRDEYPYDMIIESGMYIVEDVSALAEGGREILEEQGIRSLAIIPFYDNDIPLGYVGFDDCVKTRVWSNEEIQFLKNISALVAVLVKRRNAERDALHTHNVLNLILDNSTDIIYANSIKDYSLKYVSRSLCELLGKPEEELLGRRCYEVFAVKADSPCPECPIRRIEISPGEDKSEVFTRENTNLIKGKTFLAKGSVIRWVDGGHVYFETSTDISERMEYERQLSYLASIDTMTGIYNREWGSRLLEEKLESGDRAGSLCFIDIDGLKRTNDSIGHSAGDEMLIETVGLLKEHMKKHEILCRWGGDEFLAWFDCDENSAEEKIKRVQSEADKINAHGERSYKLSFSYGIVRFTPGQSNESMDALITKADSKMYDNKLEKRGIAYRRRKGEKRE